MLSTMTTKMGEMRKREKGNTMRGQIIEFFLCVVLQKLILLKVKKGNNKTVNSQ